ncbi:testis development-related protein isoform X1 [Equus przewalskii]|uniref:Testis development-related protein isoform X1 n=1 Tax=Equus przewalskii TaxID=9798 RepID=A0ABM4MPE7_EQUPR
MSAGQVQPPPALLLDPRLRGGRPQSSPPSPPGVCAPPGRPAEPRPRMHLPAEPAAHGPRVSARGPPGGQREGRAAESPSDPPRSAAAQRTSPGTERPQRQPPARHSGAGSRAGTATRTTRSLPRGQMAVRMRMAAGSGCQGDRSPGRPAPRAAALRTWPRPPPGVRGQLRVGVGRGRPGPGVRRPRGEEPPPSARRPATEARGRGDARTRAGPQHVEAGPRPGAAGRAPRGGGRPAGWAAARRRRAALCMLLSCCPSLCCESFAASRSSRASLHRAVRRRAWGAGAGVLCSHARSGGGGAVRSRKEVDAPQCLSGGEGRTVPCVNCCSLPQGGSYQHSAEQKMQVPYHAREPWGTRFLEKIVFVSPCSSCLTGQWKRACDREVCVGKEDKMEGSRRKRGEPWQGGRVASSWPGWTQRSASHCLCADFRGGFRVHVTASRIVPSSAQAPRTPW